MRCDHFEAVVYEGAIYCVGGCFVGDTNNDPEVTPIFADSEWDSYPVCHCGTRHTYVNLTRDGVLYENQTAVEHALANGTLDGADLHWLRDMCELWHGGQATDAYAFLSSGHNGAAPAAAAEIRRSMRGAPDDTMADIRPDWEATLDGIADLNV